MRVRRQREGAGASSREQLEAGAVDQVMAIVQVVRHERQLAQPLRLLPLGCTAAFPP